MGVRAEDRKQAAYRALVERVLNGEGRASAELRAGAFGNVDVPPPLDTLLDKVVDAPTQVTDADFTAAKAAGYSEDELFELVVCAALGFSTRLYETGLAELDEAVGEKEAG